MTSLIPITYLDGASFKDNIISSQTLKQYFQETESLSRTREEAKKLMNEVQDKLSQAECEAQAIREAARQEGFNEGKKLIENAQTEAISEAVHWLVEEEELESYISKQMETFIRDLISHVFIEYAGEQDQAKLLATRIARHVPELLEKSNRLRIFVHPENLSSVASAFSSVTQIKVQTDPSLQPGQARIDSPFVQLRFDLEQHASLILGSLSKSVGDRLIENRKHIISDHGISKVQLVGRVRKSNLKSQINRRFQSKETGAMRCEPNQKLARTESRDTQMHDYHSKIQESFEYDEIQNGLTRDNNIAILESYSL